MSNIDNNAVEYTDMEAALAPRGNHMNTMADFVVYAPDDSICLVVEAKSTQHDNEIWAAELRRNLVMHGVVPPAPYFLLALPQHFYLWKDASTSEAVLPDYQVATEAVLPLYLRDFSVPLDEFSADNWDFLVAAWLDDLIDRPLRPELPMPARHLLVDSGLYDAVRNGSVTAHANA